MRLRTQTLECTENGEVLQITYEQVRQLYHQNPQFGFYFLQLIARRLFQNIARLESELAMRKVASGRCENADLSRVGPNPPPNSRSFLSNSARRSVAERAARSGP